MYKNRLLAIAVFCCVAMGAQAQHYLGLATGEYSAINSLYLNPASISGAKEKIVVNLFSLNLAVDNSLGTFSKLGDIGKGSTDAFNLSGKRDQPFSLVAPALELRLPAILVSLNDEHQQSFALTTRVRAMNQFNHFDPSLYQSITSDEYVDQDYQFTTTKFNWTVHAWSEIGLSYALKVLDNGPHKLRAGITLRYLGGVKYLGLKGRNFDASYKKGSDTVFASHSDLSFASNAIKSDDVFSNGVTGDAVFSSLFGAKSGSGFGMDIGVSYTYTFDGDELSDEDNSGDARRITVSAAVRDIGAIKYKQGENFVVNVTGNGYLTGQGLEDHTNSYQEFRNYVVTQGFTVDTGSFATKVYMPTTMLFGVDYQIIKHIAVNATFIGNLANRQNYGNSYYGRFTITPRFENKFFTVALPLGYSWLAKDIKMGLGFRVAGFFFGSDDMLALLSSNQHGMGFYFGGYVPIFKKHKKDRF
ncbi:MAG: Outer rane porin [Flavipsychrobacter sp.]|jgi:hypothetical protein|nr:Outer rane porin [Flavipsychrobacter sp.]